MVAKLPVQSPVLTAVGLAFFALNWCNPLMAQIEYLPGIQWPEPKVVSPGDAHSPPSDAIVLFDGQDLSAWENGGNWIVDNGEAVVGKGDIKTKQGFGDCQLHIEWSAPTEVKGNGQGRGNSGVFIMDTYEVQVLDSYNNPTYFEGQAGAIYKQTPPAINAMKPPGKWNIYDIIWTAPRFDDAGQLRSPAYITALHNGVLILNHFELLGDTPWHRPPKYQAHADKLPIRLQDHGNPVRYRNIWLRELKPITATQLRPPVFHNHDTGEETPVE